MKVNPAMPLPEANGFTKTLNGMGYMTAAPDPYSLRLIDFAATAAPGPMLDIGAAYGVASLEALRRGCSVLANDIDSNHLEILRSHADKVQQERLTLVSGKFPDELAIDANSIGAVLICRVLHFFDGDTIEKSARAVFRWLRPGGKVVVVAETPYLRNFRDFIPVYEDRISRGEKWPGLIDDVMAFAPDRGKFLPKLVHWLDPEVLSRVFCESGFEIDEAKMFPRTDFPADIQLDGRESVGMIAVKPG